MTTVIKDGITTVEQEIKKAEVGEGALFGETAMIDPEKNQRTCSLMAKTDCIFVLLNHEAFNLLVKAELKRERENLT